MDIAYAMPGQPHRLFLNVIHACPNACLFCVDFKGDTFYGFDLKGDSVMKVSEIVEAVKWYPYRDQVSEVYFCGIGEPLLRYDVVVNAAATVRSFFRPDTIIAINTSGTFFAQDPRVDFAEEFDLIQVSLNAESAEKYKQICRPKIPNAYRALRSFLWELRAFVHRAGLACRVELSIVDTGDVQFLPDTEKKASEVPRPDVEACKALADRLGWPLKVKKLIEDCEKAGWADFAASVRTGAKAL